MESEKFETVKLGNQEWMAKNMAVTVDRDGNELVLGKDYFYPNGDESLVAEYGLLYTFEAAMRIAPTGWHMPTDEEWKELEEYVGSQEKYRLDDNPRYIAKALASTTGWKEDDKDFTVGNDQSKNNATGFNAVPAGYYLSDGYDDFGGYAYFWSATQYDSSHAGSRGLPYFNPNLSIGFGSYYIYCGYSVRCLRDKTCDKKDIGKSEIFQNIEKQKETITTLKLGNQEWMAKNMAVTVDRDGNELVLGKDYFYPNDDESLVKEYGLLYTWDAAMRIAPAGWHLPTDEEWDELEAYVGSQEKYRLDDNPRSIAKALASTTGWEEDDEDFTVGNGQSKNNATGFNAVPAGIYLSSLGLFGRGAGFWSATQYDSSNACFRELFDGYGGVLSGSCYKDYGYSVRCLRD